ncbi:MAG: hypothetical protein LC797_21105, partial [Chloroflexi bacterium]|nr:hypothetical protein [Chloroflexota bacterium]
MEQADISTPDTPNSCAGVVPAGELVACNRISMPDAPLTDPALAPPPSCDSPMLDDGEKSWCGGTGGLTTNWPSNYMGHRTQQTLYQFNDYVRLGINRMYGGTIFEMYGSAKVNLIEQNGGAAMQLSLWAFDPNGASEPTAWFAIPTGSDLACDATQYGSEAACRAVHTSCQQMPVGGTVSDCVSASACGPWWSVAGPFNPIQAQAADCKLGEGGRVDSVTAPASGQVQISKAN